MHRKTQISALVYNTLFPAPTAQDPPSFSAHLSKNLVGEVRIETATFYGSLDTIEARYPGLNYAHGPHRKRLGRFPHHKKLFDAFDRLGLTDSEIQGFCRWEGTLWARERYERDEGVKVEDTTGIEITPWVDRRKTRLHGSSSGRATDKGINVKTDIEVEIEEMPSSSSSSSIHRRHTRTSDALLPPPLPPAPQTLDTEMHDHDDSTSDTSDEDLNVDESVGFELNQRLLHAAALRDQGANVPMDPEWEQYLKEAQERGELNIDATREALRSMAGQLAHISHAESSSTAAAAAAAAAAPAQAYHPPAAPA